DGGVARHLAMDDPLHRVHAHAVERGEHAPDAVGSLDLAERDVVVLDVGGHQFERAVEVELRDTGGELVDVLFGGHSSSLVGAAGSPRCPSSTLPRCRPHASTESTSTTSAAATDRRCC